MSSVLGGLQAGYSFHTSAFVFGAETDFQLASAAYPFQGTFRTSSHVSDDIVRIGVNYYFGGSVLTN